MPNMSKYQEIIKSWKVPEGRTTEQAWQEVQRKIAQGENRPKVVKFSWKPMVSVAAAAAVIISLVMFWPNHELKTVACALGKTEAVSLPDASVVTLNAGSEITFSDDWSKDRLIELKGQAFFEVTKGSKFSVVTPNGSVEVLGTSFDVYSRKNDFRVACHTGKVLVRVGTQTIEITPGFSALLENGNLKLSEFEPSNRDWRKGEFVFEAVPLTDVFLELERQFDVRVKMPSLDSRMYSGRFSNKNLDEALQLICLPMGLKYTIESEHNVVIEHLQDVK